MCIIAYLLSNYPKKKMMTLVEETTVRFKVLKLAKLTTL